MTPHRLLTGLLAVQCALAAYTWYPRDTTLKTEPVVPWEAERIDKIQLESVSTRHNGGDLVLSRKGDGWVVLSEHAFPSRTEPIQELLDRLLGLKRGRPISDDPSLHKKLNVAEENFTRRVTLHDKDGEQLKFFAGTASRERMNVRYPGEDEVYEVSGLGAWRMSDNSRTYLVTKPFERVDLAQLTALSISNEHGEIELIHDGGTWSAATGEPVKPAEVERIARSLTHLQVSEPVDPANDPSIAPDVSVRWTTADGTEHGYDGKKQDDRVVVLLADKSVPPFLISPVGGQADMLDTKLEDLLAPPVEAPLEDPGAP